MAVSLQILALLLFLHRAGRVHERILRTIELGPRVLLILPGVLRILPGVSAKLLVECVCGLVLQTRGEGT